MTPERRLKLSLLFLLATIVFGTVGFALLERWPLEDALYMTVITLSTVGFREMYPLDTVGKFFTVVLIIFGVGGVFYTVGNFMQYVIEGEFRGAVRRRRVKSKIEKMSGHVIICGYGRVGREVAVSLKRDGKPVVVVDTNPNSLSRCAEDGFLYLEGEASQDEVLRAAGIERASGLVSAVDSDASNIYVTLSARGLRPDLFIVARANQDASEAKLRRAGADRVISPYSLGGRRMAHLVSRPLVIDFLDTVMHGNSVEWLMEQIRIGQRSPLAGLTIQEARAKYGAGAAILAGRKTDGSMVTNPSQETLLAVGDTLVAMGTPAQLHVVEGLT